jgi:hypothetical protein
MVPGCDPSTTSTVKGKGVGYMALASRRHCVPWISTEIPFCGFRRLIEIVPRCAGSKPGRVAAVSLATDTITPMLAWFSTSKAKAVYEGVGEFAGEALAGAGLSEADGRTARVSEVGPGAGEQAPSANRSAATVNRICVLPSRRCSRRSDGA